MTETLSPRRRVVLNFGFWSFVLVSDFDIRASNFNTDESIVCVRSRLIDGYFLHASIEDVDNLLGSVGHADVVRHDDERLALLVQR